MNDHTDNTADQIDPVQRAAETLLYGSPDDAAVALRQAIHAESDRMANHKAASGRVQRELAASQKVAEEFAAENPQWAQNPLIVGAVKAGMAVEQLNDLLKAGFDIGQFAEKMGRPPSHDEIFNMHLQARANGNPNVRSAKELFNEGVAAQIEGQFGVRRRVTDIDSNRKRGAQNMVNERRALRGLPPEELGEERPTPRAQSRDGDRPVSATTPEEYTRAQFGYGRDADDAVDAQMMQSRKNAITDRMNRNIARDSNVRVNRTAEDRRYPDRVSP
jgi:hypothetical protein